MVRRGFFLTHCPSADTNIGDSDHPIPLEGIYAVLG
jgi:hypothetical protein